MKSRRMRIPVMTIVSLATICVFNACAIAEGKKIFEPEERFESKKETKVAESSSPSKIPSSRKKAPYVHTVRWKGETLFHISKWYTGSSYNWKAIAAANRGLDPDKIHIGEKIVIPENLLKNRKPMTKDSLPSFRKEAKIVPVDFRPSSPPQNQPVSDPDPKSTQTASPSPETVPDDEPGEIELFGPVDLD